MQKLQTLSDSSFSNQIILLFYYLFIYFYFISFIGEGGGLLVGQHKALDNTTLDSGNFSCVIFGHVIDQTINQ